MKRAWFLFESLSTRAKLALMLLLIILPFTLLLTRSTLERYHLLLENTQSKTLLLAQVAAADQREVIAQTRQLLETIASNPVVRNQHWAACNNYLLQFWQQFQDRYSNFHIADSQGNIVCSGLPQSHSVGIADRQDFQDAVTSRTLIVGDLAESRTTGLLSIQIRYPLIGSDSKVTGIITAQIPAEQFVQAAAMSSMPAETELIIADRNNKIIVHSQQKELVNTYIKQGPLADAMHTPNDDVIQAVNSKGKLHVYGITRTDKTSNDGLNIAIGFPLAKVVSEVEKNLVGDVLSMFMVIALAVVFTWFGVDALVLRKVGVLIKTVSAIREGDASARTGLVYGRDELSHVARAVDETAEELERVLTLLREQTVRDPLTTLFNRRYLSEHLTAEIHKTRRNAAPIGIIMADVDYFKRVNDTYGHGGGDAVLVAVAKALLENARAYDIVCRYGGEEFAIILPGANQSITVARAEAIRRSIEALIIELDEGKTVRVTLSLGVAIFPDHGEDEHAILTRADEALYEAKGAGRNRVMVAGEKSGKHTTPTT